MNDTATATQPITEEQRIASELLNRAARMLDDAAGGSDIERRRWARRPDLAVMSDAIGLLGQYVAHPVPLQKKMAACATARLHNVLVNTVLVDTD